MTRPGSQFLRIALALLILLLPDIRANAAQVSGAAPNAKAPRTTTIKNIQIDRSGDLWTVRIEADGPLPAPKIGELDAPARVFLDFAGVRTTTNGVPGVMGAPVVRVRAAVHSTAPLVTRVVIDLAYKQPIRTESEQIDAGQFTLLVGEVALAAAPEPQVPASPETPAAKPGPEPRIPTSAEAPVGKPASSGIPPVAALPPPQPNVPSPQPSMPPDAPTGAPIMPPPAPLPSPARTMTPPVPARDAERYREQMESTLTRYRRLRPTLASIDRQDPKPPEDLTAAREEFAAVLRALTAYRASDTVRSAHDLLVRSASFALMAATLRNDAGARADPEKMRNAASAAAGALLLLDRACTELGCSTTEAK